MPDYHFTGAFPRLLAGLSQGVNALILPADEDAPPYGATIEARTGDWIRTDEPYEHPELEEFPVDLVTESPLPLPDTSQDGIQVLRDAAAAAEPVVPIQLVAAPAPTEPAHDAMTAEGAPAPAETL